MTWAAAWALLRRFWWAVPMVALAVALAVALVATRATLADRTQTLKNERGAWSAEIARTEHLRTAAEARFATNLASAQGRYAETLANREPLIVRSTETVREYAKTDAGRVLCRSADRVHAIDALDAGLADATRPAGSGEGTVHGDPAAPAAGR